ncbi:uncharacterized protein [Myotis yumanensis]|uniref:uncharacterized protein n=1 Tax=Myotis yumanensis TaxID=159337 RepID=UPI0038D46D64
MTGRAQRARTAGADAWKRGLHCELGAASDSVRTARPPSPARCSPPRAPSRASGGGARMELASAEGARRGGARSRAARGPESAAAGSPPAPDSPLPLADDDDGEGAGHGGAASRTPALSTTAWSGTNGLLAEGQAAGAQRGSWSRPPRSLRRRATVFVRMTWQSSTQALMCYKILKPTLLQLGDVDVFILLLKPLDTLETNKQKNKKHKLK